MKKVYAFKNNEEELLNSSSGGAFIAVCKAFECIYGGQNVSFYGATLDDDLNVIHKRVDSAKKCSIFQGSKYVKSNHSLVLKEIEKDILSEKKILFSGTPCQIAAVKKYLEAKKINYENIFYIDIICHGTPQVKIWNDYKRWLEKKYNSRLIKYSFRYKPEGWKAYPAYAEFENGKKLINTAETSVFSRLHMLGYITIKGCFSCPFAIKERQGDITLGDYWGIEYILKDFPREKGVSLVILNNSKMKKIVDNLDKYNYGSLLLETKGDNYLKYQHNLNNNTVLPKNYNEFVQDYDNNGFDFILNKYLNYGIKYKILFLIKKIIRKTPLIHVYRNLKKKRG